MRRAALLLLLVASGAWASGAQSQDPVNVGYGLPCVYAESVRLLASGVAAPAGPDAVSTDGFGLRFPGARGDREGFAAGSILDDAALAWRLPAHGGSAFECPDLAPTGLRYGGSPRLTLTAEAGNETGDPGPLRYLDPGLPNVDKTGPDYEATLRLPRAVVSARWRDFLPTDPALAPRVFAALDGRFPKRKGLALGASGEVTDRVRITAEALAAEDLPFEETLGREVPALRRRAGLRADARVGAWWNAHVLARGEALLRPSWSLLDVDRGIGPDWREGTAEAGVSYADWRTQRPLALGARVRQRQAAGPGLLDGSVTTAEVRARREMLEARAVVGPGGIGGEAAGEVWHRWGVERGTLRGAMGGRLRRVLPEEAPDLAFWVARGYAGLASAATPLALDGAPVPEERVELDVSLWGWRGLGGFVGHWEEQAASVASAGVDASRGETVLVPAFGLSPEAVAVSGPVRAVTASGAVLRAEAHATWSRTEIVMDVAPSLGTWLDVWVRGRVVLGGDAAFRLAREREPALRAGANARHSPDGLLRLDARLEWRAGTRWTGWPEPDLPAALLLDLGAARTFGAFELALTGRNVLGAREQTHPLGATLDGRLFARLTARF